MFPLTLDYYAISLFVGGIVAISAGSSVYLTNPTGRSSLPWLLLNFASAIWSFGYFLMITASSASHAMTFDWILHVAAICIPVAYFWFIVELTEARTHYRDTLYALAAVGVAFELINDSPFFLNPVLPKYIFNYAPDAGPLYIFFTLYFLSIICWALFILYKGIKNAPAERALRLKYVLVSSIAGFIGGGSVFFLTFNINFPPVPLILFALYPIIIALAIMRHNLFNVKLVATELLTFALWGLLLYQTIIAETSNDQIRSLFLFLAAIVFGIFLIMSVKREVDARAHIEVLAKRLEHANQRLKALDQQKSEFISIAAHQLRTPVTAIKGYSSLILEGSYGKTTKKLHEVLTTIYDSSDRMADTIEDFLNVSRIELGRMEYHLEPFDLDAAVEETVRTFQLSAKEKGLKLTCKTDECAKEEHMVQADAAKLQHVINNLIDNAIKYTPEGSVSVHISCDKPKRMIKVSVTDTGAGIPKEALSSLFSKFVRAKNAKTINVSGSGLGLYVAKQMIEAHHGKIWAESEGEEKGSSFIFEVPLLKKQTQPLLPVERSCRVIHMPENLPVAFQGERGANSDIAARAVYPEHETLPCTTFDDAFAAVREERAAAAMIPIDNSIAGRVADIHTLLPHAKVKIIGEYFQPIEHRLLGVKGSSLETIKEVRSHIHALAQCRNYITAHKFKPIVAEDTAGAARQIAELNDPTVAAIATPLAKELYGLEELARDIEDAEKNTTRFIIVTKEAVVPSQDTPCITSIFFTVRSVPAALYKAIGGFATNGVNLIKLESYIGKDFSSAHFYVEAEAHVDEQRMKYAMEELQFFSSDIEVLGTYPSHPARKDHS